MNETENITQRLMMHEAVPRGDEQAGRVPGQAQFGTGAECKGAPITYA